MAVIPSDLAESLTQDEIPIKLRCASCNKLVVNAYRLPCCDQNVCENCQASLPEACPVCMHSPLSADDCKPNKALRLTVKAFLKNEEKKRDKLEAVASAVTPRPAPIIEPSEQSTHLVIPSIAFALDKDQAISTTETSSLEATATEVIPVLDSIPKEIESQSTVGVSNNLGQAESAPVVFDTIKEDAAVNISQSELQTKEQGRNELWAPSNELNQQQLYDNNYGFATMNNSFGQQNWNGDYNSVLNMQNGMMAGQWPAFPNMMGMSGMGMDPMMMSQGMFGGFNGQGMGMNGMPTGVGFDGGYGGWGGQATLGIGGMNGGFGANAGYYPTAGYNQQSHQGHFNQMQQPQYPMNNSNQNRFRGQAYSQRGFDRGMARQVGPGHTFGNVAVKHGGEITDHQLLASAQSRQIPPHAEVKSEMKEQQPSPINTSLEISKSLDNLPFGDTNPSEEVEKVVDNIANSIEADTKTDEQYDNLAPADAESADRTEKSMTNGGDVDEIPVHAFETDGKEQVLQPIATVDTSEPPPFQYAEIQPINIVPSLGPNVPLGPAAQFATPAIPEFIGRGRGSMRPYGRGAMMRGMFRGRGGVMRVQPGFDHNGVQEVQATPPPPIGQGVVGAPTGPKAMREGNPSAGLRGRGGFQIAGRGAKFVAPVVNVKPSLEQKSPSTEPQKLVSRSPSPPKSRSRSRSRSRQRPHRHRSVSMSDHEANDANEANDSSDRYGSKKRRKSHYRHETEAIEDDHQQERHKHSRDASVESKHRSHREKGKSSRSSRHGRSRSPERRKRPHRSRDRDQDTALDSIGVEASVSKEARSLSSSRVAHHSKRDHTRDERDRDRGKERDRDRDRDRKRSRRDKSESPDYHSHRKDSARSKPVSTMEDESMVRGPSRQLPPTGPREFKIKDRSKRPLSELDVQKAIVRKERPDMDAHTLEREVRNRERTMREMQRRESLHGGVNGNSGTGRKRSADDEVSGFGMQDNGGQQKTSRRKVRHGEDRKSRRGGWHYEDDENGEARAARIEKEREAARWG